MKMAISMEEFQGKIWQVIYEDALIDNHVFIFIVADFLMSYNRNRQFVFLHNYKLKKGPSLMA